MSSPVGTDSQMTHKPDVLDNHSGKVYRLLNLETKKVVFSRDVQWLEQNYQTFMKSQGFEDDDHEEDSPEDSEDENEVVVDRNDGSDALADEPDANNDKTNTGETQGVTWPATSVVPLARATRSAVSRAGRRVAPSVNTTNLNTKHLLVWKRITTKMLKHFG